MIPSDAELARDALAGSQSACRVLVARYATPAVNLAARLVNDRALGEDLAQEAFVRAFAKLDTYDPDRKFSSWFFQIVHNVTIDYLRRRRLDTVSLDALHASGHAIPAASRSAAPDALAEQKGLALALEEALAGIRPEYREAVILRYQDGLSQPEVAEVMGVPVGTVKTYLHRARKELAQLMTARGWRAETVDKEDS